VAPQRSGTINYPNNSEVSNVINSFMRSSYLDPAADTINIQLNNQNIEFGLHTRRRKRGLRRFRSSILFHFSHCGSVNISTTVLMRNES